MNKTGIDKIVGPLNEEAGIQNEAWMDYVTNAWSRRVAQPFLIATMTAALVAGPLAVIQTISPAIPWRAFILVSFFIALQSIYTSIWLARPRQRSLNKTAYRVAEFVVITLIVRLLAWAFTNNWPDLDTWRNYLFEPLTFFYDAFFLVMLIFIFMIWQSAIYTGEIFAKLALDTAEAAYYADAFGKHKLDNRPVITNRSQLITGFLQRWLWGGLILVICAALSTFDLSSQSSTWSPLAMGRLALPPELLMALMLYFLAGFLLLSQGRLAMMNARWLINGVAKAPQVERSWYRSSLWLLVFVGFMAAFLPLGSTIGLSRIVAAIVTVVTAVVTFLWFLFFSLLALLLPSQLSDINTSSDQPLPPPIPVTPAPTSPTGAGDTATIIFSSAFWAIASVMTVIAILFFLRERGYRLDGKLLRLLWNGLSSWLGNLWRGLSIQAGAARQAIQNRRQLTLKDTKSLSFPSRRFIRLNALSPRDQLRYFYLSTVRRAVEQGVERDQSETPLEYAQDLKENWPDAEIDVVSLTDAFLKARYSPKSIVKQDVSPIKQHWKQLRAKLRQRSRRQKENI